MSPALWGNPIKRDLSFLLSVQTTYDAVADLLRESGGLLTDFTLFDTYQGKGVPTGKKSMTFHLTLSAPDRTLSGEEADAALAVIAQLLETQLGALIRR